MISIKPCLAAGLAATALTLPWAVRAAVLSASCTATVNYSLNGDLLEPYTRDFVVQEGVTFVDDFSTPTRQKVFTATLVRDGARSTISIDYFNDVGTFTAISMDTAVRLLRPGATDASAGRHGFYASSGVVGTHLTDYALSCRGQ